MSNDARAWPTSSMFHYAVHRERDSYARYWLRTDSKCGEGLRK